MTNEDPFYSAWKNFSSKILDECWKDEPRKGIHGVTILLKEFLESYEDIDSCTKCMQVYWKHKTNITCSRKALTKVLNNFKSNPKFGSISHLYFLRSLDELKIMPFTDEERNNYDKYELLLGLCSAIYVDRLGRFSQIRNIPIELLRLLKNLL
jgi:hypothetical protein